MDLSEVSQARSTAKQRIGWTAVFAKAHALASVDIPELRDLFVKRPLRHLYRHPASVLSVSIHRKDDQGTERLIWGQISNVETMSLVDLQNRFDQFVHAPLKTIYKDGLILEAAPVLARRLVWRWVMNWGARKRAKHVGTYSISSLAGMNCLNAYHPLVTSSSLAFGPLHSSGRSDVVLLCDHRVIDGVLGARILDGIEEKLRTSICAELSELDSAGS